MTIFLHGSGLMINKPGASGGDHKPPVLLYVQKHRQTHMGSRCGGGGVVRSHCLLWASSFCTRPRLLGHHTLPGKGIGYKNLKVNRCQHTAFSPWSWLPVPQIPWGLNSTQNTLLTLNISRVSISHSTSHHLWGRKTKGFIVNVLLQRPLPFILKTVKVVKLYSELFLGSFLSSVSAPWQTIYITVHQTG